jgi:hypothetical protein
VRTFTGIDEERRRVVVTFGQSIVLHDVMEMMLTSAKASVLGYATLVDARDARIEISPADVSAILATHSDLATQHRIAKMAVLVNDAEQLSIVDSVSDVVSHISPVKGFLDRSGAERWLGWIE